MQNREALVELERRAMDEAPSTVEFALSKMIVRVVECKPEEGRGLYEVDSRGSYLATGWHARETARRQPAAERRARAVAPPCACPPPGALDLPAAAAVCGDCLARRRAAHAICCACNNTCVRIRFLLLLHQTL